jgi:molybdenum cofactor cytidylyltransferase
MRFRPTIIVLAAGRGSRFGGTGHKLAQAFGTSTVLGTTVSHAVQTQLPVLVITTAPLLPLVTEQVAGRDTLLRA